MNINLQRKEKDDLLRNIGELYQKELLTIRLQNVNIVTDYKEEYLSIELMLKINDIIKAMRFELSLVIKREYLTNNGYDWWKSYFSKQTYEMLKIEAQDEFLSCLYN